MRETFFKKLARLICRHHTMVLVMTALICAASLVSAAQIRLLSDIVQMLPQANPVTRQYLDAIQTIQTADYLVVVLSGPDSARLMAFSDRLAPAIMETGLVSDVRYKVTPEEKEFILHDYLPRICLTLDDVDFTKFAEKLRPTAVEEAVALDKRLLLSPGSSRASELIQADPLNFLSITKDRLFAGEGGIAIRDASGYFLINEGKRLLLIVRPVKGPSDFSFTKKLIEDIRAAVFRIREKGGANDIVVELTGNYAVIYDNLKIIKRDLNLTTIVAFILVLLFFFFVFRRLSILCYVGITLTVGILWTLGFVGIAVSHLTMVTASSGAILLGLGIDFSVHIYNRYLEEIGRGLPYDRAIEIALAKIGPGILAGATTTAVAFLSLCFSRLKVLSELGVIGGVGILMFFVSACIVLPALIAASKRHAVGQQSGRALSIPAFGMGGLGRFILRANRVIIVCAAIITIVMALMMFRIGFENNVNELLPKDNEALLVKDKIQVIKSGYLSAVIVSARGRSLDEALTIAEKVEGVFSSYSEIASVGSPGAFLPSSMRQDENVSKIEGLDMGPSIDAFHRSLKINGFAPERFSAFDAVLESYLSGDIPRITYEGVMSSPAAAIVNRYVRKDDGTWRVFVFAYPYAGLWEEDIDRGLVKHIKAISDDVDITSFGMVMAEMKRLAISDFFRAIILASCGTLLILIVQMRSFRPVFFCMLSLGMGVVWMMGFMGMAGIPMNYANIGVAPMIIGIGIDNNIHLYHRFRESGQGGVVDAMIHIGRAVIVCAVTTIVGFGSLLISKYPGLNSIGLLSALGVFFCLSTAVLVLPSLLVFADRKRPM